MFQRKNKPNGITEEVVLQALSTVIEPELHRDLVSLNMIRDLKIEGNDVNFTIMLTTPACPLRSKMERDSRAALAQLPAIGQVTIQWDSNVPHDRRINQQIGQNFRNTIAVSSGKGGVGKTTVAVNLAISLAGAGARVGLLDADILGPNVPIMMGVETMPPPRNRKMIPAEQYGVKFISMAFLTRPDQPLVWRGPMLHSAIRQLLTDVEWGELDYLVIDLPPGTGDAQLSLAQAIPLSGAVIVTQPMQVAAADALRGLKMFEKLDVPIIGIVENMSGDFFGSGAGEQLAQNTGAPFLGSVPLDANVRVGGDTGRPIVVAYPDSPAAQAFEQLTKEVAARVSVLTLGNQSNFIPIQVIG
ncbi:MAG: Mrp/NBP35 family ATP-binding protein [Chloroflexi bacterium]|nr:Mrp/NBP35 family ATP-binding protein [Chloroflexota bacterium]MCI0579354.1 Mrp/NBP35 family ATP-binding protein [Chloroflexota bacterium]MCI0646013.1 Mrp/NBP35 family ATP-binding protein [Chloroflexota bacterium]MCI0727435.1 Mrp/NBP35 family ATP-binding protein [Chloroflexota bacterium]